MDGESNGENVGENLNHSATTSIGCAIMPHDGCLDKTMKSTCELKAKYFPCQWKMVAINKLTLQQVDSSVNKF
jgi:hypothetical protein